MKRDFELIKTILKEAESISADSPVSSFEYPGEYDQEVVDYHTELLITEGFLKGEALFCVSGYQYFMVYGLCWKGHEFIEEAFRDESIWEKGKAFAASQSPAISAAILLEWLKEQLF
ncbi:DUF2513 domain-containing protein [Methylovulum psychrotolerans]|uniref:DUF2513 domain-containing protein n=1 Tax=Methylovulum psychrotolerans TaxID=1704499 RepID=UPI001BFF62D9|nr:DUF2513 domain-containing protein [Methylovulum psychrotolerans]MBT9097874.1 DUF2513 domain-containing protein [Methylovulum psychrotolerans]